MITYKNFKKRYFVVKNEIDEIKFRKSLYFIPAYGERKTNHSIKNYFLFIYQNYFLKVNIRKYLFKDEKYNFYLLALPILFLVFITSKSLFAIIIILFKKLKSI